MDGELDLGPQIVEGDWEGNLVLLPSQGDFGVLVTTVYDDARAGVEGWPEERKAHDVVPMEMGKEYVKFGPTPEGRAAPRSFDSEFAQS